MKLNVEVEGPQDGVPVVFLHGVSGSSRTYAWLPEEIVGSRRILLVDLRGHGESGRAAGAYGIGDYGEDVAELLRGLGRPAILVGHSLGGVAAWWVAQRYPELVVAAFLEDPPLYMGEPAEHERNVAVPRFRAMLEMAAQWRADGVSVEAAAAELAGGAETFDDTPAAVAYGLLTMDPAVLEGAADRSTLADTDTASPVTVPVFLLAGDPDTGSAFAARHQERLARTHPDVEVVRLPGAPHWIHDSRDHRDAYVEHLARFLAAHG